MRSGAIAGPVGSAFVLALGLVGCGASDPGQGVLPGVEALVFASRAFTSPGPDGVLGSADDVHHIADGNAQVIDYDRYVPGGGVYVLRPPAPNGTLTNLTENFDEVDINGMDLSFDARQVVFSMRHAGDDSFHIYVANLDGTEVRQLTMGPSSDVMPIYIPGDRIAYVSNLPYTAMGLRQDEYERGGASQIATISIEGGEADRRLCSQNLSHVSSPYLLSTGEIGFSRWEHLGPINDVKMFRMNPDCTGMTAVAGQFNKNFNSLVQATEVEPGQFIAIGTSRSRTIQAGALIHVDARSETTGAGAQYIDVQAARFNNLTPTVPTGPASPPSSTGRYRYPRSLPNETRSPETRPYIVSWADGPVNDSNELAETAPDFGIYLFNPQTQQRTLIYDARNTWEGYAIPVARRENIPPVIGNTVELDPDPNTPAVIGSVNVATTSLDESVTGGQFNGESLHDALGQATHVRIIEGFSGEIGGVRMFGLTMHEGAAILGETPVYADGSWRAQVPAYLPYHLQPIDRFGMSIRNQMLWIQAMPGETRVCGGCHESRSDRSQAPVTLAQQAGADTTTFRNIPDRLELPWFGSTSRSNIQELFDARCVSCHSGTGNVYADRTYNVAVTMEDGSTANYTIPYLDLGSQPITVEYENEAVAYPASYVTLLYPSAMMGDVMVTGDVPPQWVVPGSARTSRLIEALNMPAEDVPTDLAWTGTRNVNVGPMHPEDVGVTLTREERLTLARMADLGGQYYTRTNNGGNDYSASGRN